MKSASEQISRMTNTLQAVALQRPRRRPWIERERRAIIRVAKECLGIRDEWIPEIRASVAGETRHGVLRVHRLRAQSWEHCFGAAHLFLPPAAAPARLPLVIVCCGHGKGGKQALGYQQAAWRLAHMGCAVLVPDNIGQGERTAMGHADVVMPFQCGLSLQGLIVMETVGWLRWAQADPRFDATRLAAIGNSGGGTLTLFLGALCRDELAALSSSGYPSRFDFIAAKEKKHCHCNILPGVVGRLEMWQLYGCFAPKPLFLFQGQHDNLFPEDLFYTVCREVAEVYRRRDAAAACRTTVFPGEHAWDETRRKALAAFLGEVLELDPECAPPAPLTEPVGNCYAAWPDGALTADTLAAALSGVNPKPLDALFQVYLPELASFPDTTFQRVGFRQLAAQLQAFSDGRGTRALHR